MGAIVSYIICALLSYGIFYLFCPAINFMAPGFWVYLIIVLLLFCGVSFSIRTFKDEDEGPTTVIGIITGVGSAILVVIMLFAALFGSHLFRAKDYANLIAGRVESKSITEYTPTIDNVPLMDRDTAELLANRTMGSLVEEVSQFDLGRSWQINYQGRPIRVVPLEYAGFFKWINNKAKGIPSFITVDMKTQRTEIHTLEQGMRYSPSGYFGDDLRRHLRFMYPTTMMSEPIFEIDEEGNPYWVVSKLTHRIGLFGGEDVTGILIVDAITGDIKEYEMEDIPRYVDNAFSVDVLLNLYNNYGMYQGGFWNAHFGQKNVVQVTEGYNYIPKDDDIYVYTGVTSVASDESNIGFIFVNMRTKAYEYYEIAGAEEYSAMASAEGVVQHLGYTSTFPLILSIEGQPTYCVALKDAGGLVKMYGLVNMEQYQIVVTGNTIADCLRDYRVALKNNGQSVIEIAVTENKGVVEDIRTGSINGTTMFYIKFENDKSYYSFMLSENENIILIDIGDEIKYNIADDETSEGYTSEKIIPATLVE